MYTSLITLVLASVIVAPDTLVVCPNEYQPAIKTWLEYRQSQGHIISVVAPPQDAELLKGIIKQANAAGPLKHIVLMGDVAGTDEDDSTIPTNFVPAKVNKRWGSTPTIASDVPFADIDNDGIPDIAVGRIPANSRDELERTLAKIIRYERETHDGDWQNRLDIIAGVGGFGALTDSLIEAAGRQVFQQAVPSGYEFRHTSVKSAAKNSSSICDTACQHLNEGSLAWIYLGHGLPTELDRVATASGPRSILSVDDLPKVRCEQCRALAVLVACYTGAFDANVDCLAEKLATSDTGPVAVIAATRVTMPYGNMAIGYELLRACFTDRPETLGEAICLAQVRTLKANKEDKLRPSLDSIATGISPAPVDLEAERIEHVLMYHLFGDPLLRLRLSSSLLENADSTTAERASRSLPGK